MLPLIVQHSEAPTATGSFCQAAPQVGERDQTAAAPRRSHLAILSAAWQGRRLIARRGAFGVGEGEDRSLSSRLFASLRASDQ
jgi:hypothetical protein